jgi:hypothetical protein
MPKSTIVFGKPVVGPKVYIAKGPSGWPEQIDRRRADAALGRFLDPLDADEVVGAFALDVQTGRFEDTWGGVVTFLARLTDRHPTSIPELAALALWGQALLQHPGYGPEEP